jgi:hypothetical protein
MEARGLELDDMIEGVSRGNMDLLGDWIIDADRTLNF